MNLNHGHTKYREEHCEMLIEHMAQGYSFESFSAVIRVGKTTLYLWVKEIPAFKEAKEIGEAMALKFFETAIKSASTNQSIDDKIIQQSFDPKNINVPTMQWFIKNRFHNVYSEKNITVIEGGEKPVEISKKVDLSNLSIDELKTLRAIKEKVNAGNAE